MRILKISQLVTLNFQATVTEIITGVIIPEKVLFLLLCKMFTALPINGHNMAAVRERNDESVPHINTESYLKLKLDCKSCIEYQYKLEELFLELASAKKVIQLLQEEQSVYSDPTAEETTEEGHNPRVSNELNNHWVTNTSKSRKIKQVNSYPNVQQIKTHNRFQVLEQFRDYSDSGDGQKSKKS